MKATDRAKKIKKNINVIEAVYVKNFRLKVFFDDGSSQTVDLSEFLGNPPNPVYKKYLKEKNLKNFEIINGNVNWNDYEMIFPVADLYRGVI